MSLNKAIEHGKEHRQPYRKSKRFDHTCRPHGSCSYCYGNRTHGNRRRQAIADDTINEWNDIFNLTYEDYFKIFKC